MCVHVCACVRAHVCACVCMHVCALVRVLVRVLVLVLVRVCALVSVLLGLSPAGLARMLRARIQFFFLLLSWQLNACYGLSFIRVLFSVVAPGFV